ncbi:MAG TPA: polyprenol monophosphomannose synthase [Vicinamibacterales bacterium]
MGQNLTTASYIRSATLTEPPPTPAPAAPALSIVVPTYNERTRIVELIHAVFDTFRAASLDGELVIVDDNSPDGTGAAADACVPAYGGRLIVRHRAGKLGLGTAVMHGFLAGHAPIVGVMDADFSHPPSLIPRLHRVLLDSGVDAVVGSRYIPGGEARNWPVGRLLLSKLACVLARPLTPVRDATSGCFLVRRSAIDGVAIAAGGFKICLELLVRGRVASVAEVPYVFTDRTAGTSKMTVREAANYLTQLRQLYWVRLTGPRQRVRYVRCGTEPEPAPEGPPELR